MGCVLAISSQVARGHVGLGAMIPALQSLGHEIIALPTILLSNHPGHPIAAGQQVSPDLLQRMLEALDKNGWLSGIDAILTGYLPTSDHVRCAADAIRVVREKSQRVRVLVDPVLGDEPKGLYINSDAAARIRDDLIGLADAITPNAFELGWLTSRRISNEDEAFRAARSLAPQQVLATSVPAAGGMISNVLVQNDTGEVSVAEVPHKGKVPNGTGDFLSALFLGHGVRGADANLAFALAVAGVDAAVAASARRDELALIASKEAWADPVPWPVRTL